MYEDIEYLNVELPEDILKKKWYGDFEGANRLIDIRMAQPIPKALRKKLELEKRIMRVMEREYPCTYEQALAMVQEKIPDFTEAEFQELEAHSKIDWIYVNGREHYFADFLDTLLAVNNDLIARARAHKKALEAAGVETLTPQQKEEKRKEDELERKKAALLMDTIHEIKEKKRVKYHYHMRASVWIDEDKFVSGRVLVHLPVPKNCEQFSNIRILRTEPEAFMIDDIDAPQRTVSFRTELKENRTFTVEYEFDTEVRYAQPDAELVAKVLQPALTHDAQGNPVLCERPVAGCTDAVRADAMKEYLVYENSYPVCAEDLSEQQPHIRFTPFLRAVAAELAGDEKNPYLLAKRVYDYVTTKITYSYMRSYFAIENIPEYAALGGKGDCGVQALLFITLCRILGVPARWQSGLNATPYSVSSHDWAQFYVAPYGWLFADCSFGGSGYRNGNEEKHAFYFGNLDPFRMIANSSYQKEFNPPKKYLRHDPYDNQSGEIEYEDRGLTMEDYSRKREVLEVSPCFPPR